MESPPFCFIIIIVTLTQELRGGGSKLMFYSLDNNRVEMGFIKE